MASNAPLPTKRARGADAPEPRVHEEVPSDDPDVLGYRAARAKMNVIDPNNLPSDSVAAAHIDDAWLTANVVLGEPRNVAVIGSTFVPLAPQRKVFNVYIWGDGFVGERGIQTFKEGKRTIDVVVMNPAERAALQRLNFYIRENVVRRGIGFAPNLQVSEKQALGNYRDLITEDGVIRCSIDEDATQFMRYGKRGPVCDTSDLASRPTDAVSIELSQLCVRGLQSSVPVTLKMMRVDTDAPKVDTAKANARSNDI